MDNVMNCEHPKWIEFMDRLAGEGYCDFRVEAGIYVWDCDRTKDRPFARALLAEYGCDIDASMAFFSSRGGHCDCEIVFNVGQHR